MEETALSGSGLIGDIFSNDYSTLGGTFFEPTVLIHVSYEAMIFGEETFGPVAPIFRVESEEEAIALENKTPFGFAAYVCARNVGRIFRVIEELEFGMVGVN